MNLSRLELVIKNSSKNNTAEIILDYLRQGKIESAKLHYSCDGDKIQSCHTIKKEIEKLIGCRTHGVTNCKSWLCNIK